jgi:putative CocE/NonD family hydrolase
MALEVSTYPFAVKVTENIFIPLPDGTRLAAKLWQPEGAGAVPVILEYIPYRKRDGTRVRDEAMHAWLAGHGYACVRLDIRGTGDSEGIIHDEYSVQEQLDGVDAIAWLAKQDWCDGQVTMIGISWGGFNGLQIAARQPQALKTIITVGSTDDRYATDIHWVGGCLSKDNFDWSSTMFAHQDLPPDPAIVGKRWRDMWMERVAANRPWMLTWLQHQRRDAYWKQGSVCEDFSKITIPVYAVSGWADNYSEAVPRLLAGLSGPRLGLIGPWAHSYPHDVAVQPEIGWLQEVIRWCDHWMKHRETGIMDEPMLRAWMQDSVPPRTCYLERPGRWVGEDHWPSPRIRTHILHAAPCGQLAATPVQGQAAICSPLWVGAAAGEVGRYGEDAEWATDQREDDGGSLVFTSAPLAETFEILGAPKLKIRFSSDKPQALLVVRLNDVAPSGASTKVCPGYLNLTHRDSHEHPTALVPGHFYEAEVELDDIAHAFPPGHRIAVAISTTYWPVAWPSPELATVTFDLAGTALHLPHRPPSAKDAALRPFPPAEHSPPTPHVSHPVADPPRRAVHRDLLSGGMTVEFPRWTYRMDMTDISTTTSGTAFARYRITEGDPLSAVAETGYDVQIARPDATVGHRSTGKLRCDATHFILDQTLEVLENGRVIHAKSWSERIPRDHV